MLASQNRNGYRASGGGEVRVVVGGGLVVRTTRVIRAKGPQPMGLWRVDNVAPMSDTGVLSLETVECSHS